MRFDGEREESSAVAQPFGDRTSLVNALRLRRIYRDASLRLLVDLVDVARGPLNEDGRPDGGNDAELESDIHLVRRAAESSTCLYRSLRLRRRLSRVKERPMAHSVLVAQDEGLAAPVDALTELLAASIARQFGEAAVAVTFDGAAATARIWIGEELVDTTSFRSFADLRDAVVQTIEARQGSDVDPFFHVIVAAPGAPDSIPLEYRTPPRPRWHSDRGRTPSPTGYDRVVYLTHEVPKSAAPQWVDLLGDRVRSRVPGKSDQQGPYFSSFLASIVPRPAAHDAVAAPRRNPLDRTLLGKVLYEHTLVGRLVDSWVFAGSMMQRVSREACEDAHVYFEPKADELFLVESFLFVRARHISRQWTDVKPAIEDCAKTWRRLRLGGLSMGEYFPMSYMGKKSKKKLPRAKPWAARNAPKIGKGRRNPRNP